MIDPKEASGLVRYLGPARIEIEGNRQAGMAYIQMGRSVMGALVNDMTLGKYEVGRLQKTFPDGTTIIALRHHGQHTIRIITPQLSVEEIIKKFELFLESGYVDLRPLYFNGINGPKLPGKLYYTELLEEAYATTGPDVVRPVLFTFPDRSPWLDWLYIDYLNNVFSAASSLVNPYTPGRDSEAIPADALGKRSIYHYAQPTAATGKLKLYLQCLLGMREDKLVNVKTTELLATPGTYYGTWGLYSSPSGAYFLVNLYSDRVWFYPLTTSKLGHSLQVLLGSRVPKDDFISRLKIEAYVLTETRFQPPSETNLSGALENGFVRYYISGETIPNDVTIETLAYGWKGSWAGDEWSIVVRQPIPDGPGFKWQMMRRYKLRIEEVIEDETNTRLLNPYLTLEEEISWTPRIAREIVWYPIRIPVGPEDMLWIPWQPSASYSYPLLNNDVPVYCWYDANDNLVVIRHKRVSEEYHAFDSSKVTLVQNAYTCNATNTYSEYRYAVNYATSGFYVDIIEKLDSNVSLFKYTLEPTIDEFISDEFTSKEVYSSDINIYNRYFTDWHCVDRGGGWGINVYCTDDHGGFSQTTPWISNNLGYYGPPPIDPCVYDLYSQQRYTQQELGSITTYTKYAGSWSWNVVSVLVLPMYSSEAAYIAQRSLYQYSYAKFNYEYTTPLVLYAITFGGAYGYQRFTVNNVYMGSNPNQIIPTSGTMRQSECKVSLFTKHDTIDLLNQYNEGADYAPAEKFGHIFEISYANPLLGNRIGVYAGITGDYYYNGNDRPNTTDWELCTSEKLPYPSDMQGLTIGWF